MIARVILAHLPVSGRSQGLSPIPLSAHTSARVGDFIAEVIDDKTWHVFKGKVCSDPQDLNETFVEASMQHRRHEVAGRKILILASTAPSEEEQPDPQKTEGTNGGSTGADGPNPPVPPVLPSAPLGTENPTATQPPAPEGGNTVVVARGTLTAGTSTTQTSKKRAAKKTARKKAAKKKSPDDPT